MPDRDNYCQEVEVSYIYLKLVLIKIRLQQAFFVCDRGPPNSEDCLQHRDDCYPEVSYVYLKPVLIKFQLQHISIVLF